MKKSQMILFGDAADDWLRHLSPELKASSEVR